MKLEADYITALYNLYVDDGKTFAFADTALIKVKIIICFHSFW